MSTRTDKELLAKFQQGDASAFNPLLTRHRAPIYTFLVRMIGDRERAEDLAQDTFLRIVKGAQAWQQRSRFQSWMYAIARNLCADLARRDRFRKTESLDAEPAGGGATIADGLADPGPAPDRAAERERLRPILENALLSLPVDQREIFILREQAGLPFREIAEIVSANENTVKSRMRYALAALRKALAEAGVDADTAEVDEATGARFSRA